MSPKMKQGATCHCRETCLFLPPTDMANKSQSRESPADRLRWHCKPSSIRVKTTDDARPTKEIIGQERALRALRLGLEMKYPGYNVFVRGFSGPGGVTPTKHP